VWQRLNYRTHDLLQRTAREIRAHNLAEQSQQQAAAADPGASEQLLPRRYEGDLQQDDAFDTIIQWLYWRIPFVKGGAGAAAQGAGGTGRGSSAV
jgi:hypothetical protein